MFLCIPAFYVTDEIPGKSDGSIVVAITSAIRAKDRTPFRSLIEAISIVEGVAGLMAQVHHDLARVLEVVHGFFQMGKPAVGQIERNANDRLAGRTSPLIGEIAPRRKPLEALAVQFPLELLHEALQRRSLQL